MLPITLNGDISTDAHCVYGGHDRILTGTAIPAPNLSQVHICLQNKGWEGIRRPGLPSGNCQAKFASFGPQATLHMTWKKPPSEIDVMGSVFPLTTVGIDSVILPAQDSAPVQRLADSAGTHPFNTTIFDVPQGN